MTVRPGHHRPLVALIVLMAVALVAAAANAGGNAAKPKITKLSVTSLKPPATLTITGTNLTAPKSVKIGSVKLTVKSKSATKIVVSVPSTAKTGKVVVVTAGGTATSPTTLTIKTSSSSGSTGNATAGKAIFEANCSTCHGSDGLGGNGGPDLQDEPLAKTTAGVIKQVVNGGGGMPSFRGQFTQAQLNDIAAFVANKIN